MLELVPLLEDTAGIDHIRVTVVDSLHHCELLLAEEELKTLRALFGGSGWKAIDHHLKQRDDGKA